MANDIYLDQKHNDLVDELCQGDGRVFENNAYGSVIFALVGHMSDHRVSVGSGQRREVPGSALERADAEAYAYLMAVVEQPDEPGCLRSSNDKEIWQRFEEYANGGLEIIAEWKLNSTGSVSDVVLQKMYEVILALPVPKLGGGAGADGDEEGKEFTPTFDV